MFFTAHAVSKIRNKGTTDADEVEMDDAENEAEGDDDETNQMLDWDDVDALERVSLCLCVRVRNESLVHAVVPYRMRNCGLDVLLHLC